MSEGRGIRPWLPWLAAAAVLLVALVALVVVSRPSDSDAARVGRIASHLRCPTCAGLSVADSPSSTAATIRADIARRVAAGQSSGEIRQAYVERYGEWVLLDPPGGAGLLAGLLPVLVVLAGGLGIVLAIRRGRARARGAAPDDADAALVARARDQGRSRQERET